MVCVDIIQYGIHHPVVGMPNLSIPDTSDEKHLGPMFRLFKLIGDVDYHTFLQRYKDVLSLTSQDTRGTRKTILSLYICARYIVYIYNDLLRYTRIDTHVIQCILSFDVLHFEDSIRVSNFLTQTHVQNRFTYAASIRRSYITLPERKIILQKICEIEEASSGLVVGGLGRHQSHLKWLIS
jgi:hypothetical protein